MRAGKERPKIGLALGGGSVRGLAHLGVLEVFEQENLPVDMIAGTSMGSVVGAVYAAGTDLKYLSQLVSQLSWDKLLDLKEFGFSKLGLLNGQRFETIIELLVKKRSFRELKIPMRVVATNLENGHEVIFEDGELLPALRASISIPGIFTPVSYQESKLIDGGVVAGVPVKALKEMKPDIAIGVYVGYDVERRNINNMFDLLVQVIDIMLAKIDSSQLNEADLIINPDVGEVGVTRFDKVEFCIEQGRLAAFKVLPQIKALYAQRYKEMTGEEIIL